MSFLKEDEFIILMCPNRTDAEYWGATQPVYIPTLEDRKRFRECGIQTTIEYPLWSALEPASFKYDFSAIDEILEKNEKAGMKTIFSIPGIIVPTWIPDEWCIKNKNGVDRRMVSFWNNEAEEYLINFCNTLITKYDAPNVLFIFGECENGETILPVEPSFYDDAALRSYIAHCEKDVQPDIEKTETLVWAGDAGVGHVVYVQNNFYKVKKEIWNMQQWLFNQWSLATLNYTQPKIFKWFKDIFPDAHLVLLQYTYFDDAHPKANEDWVDSIKNTYNCDVIVEAHFCDGLPSTTPKAIAKGFRGQILCPAHPMVGQYTLEPWMFNNIKIAHNLWMKSKNG